MFVSSPTHFEACNGRTVYGWFVFLFWLKFLQSDKSVQSYLFNILSNMYWLTLFKRRKITVILSRFRNTERKSVFVSFFFVLRLLMEGRIALIAVWTYVYVLFNESCNSLLPIMLIDVINCASLAVRQLTRRPTHHVTCAPIDTWLMTANHCLLRAYVMQPAFVLHPLQFAHIQWNSIFSHSFGATQCWQLSCHRKRWWWRRYADVHEKN